MKPFVKTNTSNFNQIPVKERIRYIQNQSKGLGMPPLTWKQAKATLEYVMRGDRYINDIYEVQVQTAKQVTDVWSEQLIGKIDYLSIKRRDKKQCRNWSDFQEIKNLLCVDGEKRYAVEIYPPEDKLVNTSNQYHIWVLPLGLDIGFGFRQRAIVEKNGYKTTKVNGVEFTTGQGEINETN